MTGVTHASAPRAIPNLLALVKQQPHPAKVNAEFLRKNGFSDKTVGRLVSVLEDLGFITRGGVPTERWSAYASGSQSKTVLADAIKAAYSELFVRWPDAHTKSQESIRKYFRGQPDADAAKVEKARVTFEKLCALADFSKPAASPSKQAEYRYPGMAARQVQVAMKYLEHAIKEAEVCAAHGLWRPAHVSAWNGFATVAAQVLAVDNFGPLRHLRPKWTGNSIDEVVFLVPGGVTVDMLLRLKLTTTAIDDELDRLLRLRHNCAHPTEFDPERVSSLQYIADVDRFARLVLQAAASR